MKKRVTRHRKALMSKRPWDMLTPAQQEIRKRALAALSKIRQGLFLSVAAKEVGIDSRTAAKHLGRAITKLNGKYLARPVDHISRSMLVYSQGKQFVITVTDSKAASTIGQYFNAVRQYLNTGDSAALKKFKNVLVVDSDGTKYRLETGGKKIQAIEAEKEEPEFFQIYSSR